jgi:hypothetical protein
MANTVDVVVDVLRENVYVFFGQTSENFLKIEGVKKNALSTFLVDLQRQILEISRNRTDRFFQNWPKYEEQFLVKRQKENEWMCQIKNDLVECFCLKPKKRKEVGKSESTFY